MSYERTINVSQVIDERRVSWFNIGLLIFSFFVILVDGYDILNVSFAAPYLLKEWHISGPAALGPVFSASLAGFFVGSPGLGFIGDRYGRKVAIIVGCLVFGVFTLASALATSLSQMLYLRFLTGIGLGGLLPNIIALNGEYAPRRFRATVIILMFSGITLGGAVAGGIAAWLVPSYGWQALFYVGGAVPIVTVVAVMLWMPESLKFLALREQTRARAMRMLSRLRPDLAVGPDTQLIVGGEKVYQRFSPKLLFSDGMALITPLFWLCFIINMMGYYFMSSWMPTLLIGHKVLSPTHAALALALIQIGGTLGGWVICRPMETKAFLPVAVLFALAVPCVGAIGFAALSSETLLLAVMFLAGFCVLGLQFGLNAGSAMIYPTSYRSNGSGWAFAMGRFGSVSGPIIGGFLIQMQMSLPSLFLTAAVLFVIGAIACFILVGLYRVRFKGEGFGEREAAPATSDVALRAAQMQGSH